MKNYCAAPHVFYWLIALDLDFFFLFASILWSTRAAHVVLNYPLTYRALLSVICLFTNKYLSVTLAALRDAYMIF
jgi:hypothetical protein